MTLFQCLLHGLQLSDQCQANENVNMLVGTTRAYRMLVMHDCAARHRKYDIVDTLINITTSILANKKIRNYIFTCQ